MLDKANKILEHKYHSNLVVISWMENKSYTKEYSALGLQLVDPSPYFPDFATNKDAYGIKNDGHPNARASALLAQAVVDYLRRQPR
jgi:lysophospholipase L1-like esterase